MYVAAALLAVVIGFGVGFRRSVRARARRRTRDAIAGTQLDDDDEGVERPRRRGTNGREIWVGRVRGNRGWCTLLVYLDSSASAGFASIPVWARVAPHFVIVGSRLQGLHDGGRRRGCLPAS